MITLYIFLWIKTVDPLPGRGFFFWAIFIFFAIMMTLLTTRDFGWMRRLDWDRGQRVGGKEKRREFFFLEGGILQLGNGLERGEHGEKKNCCRRAWGRSFTPFVSCSSRLFIILGLFGITYQLGLDYMLYFMDFLDYFLLVDRWYCRLS